MAYCSKCGNQVADGVGFCPQCGQPQSTASQPAPSAQANPGAGAAPGMAENVAGLLCYAVGWITGIIFFVIDKRPFVRFHAAQSIVLFGGLHVLIIAMTIFTGGGFLFGGYGELGGFGLMLMLVWVLDLAAFVLWILLMVKAYQGEKFQLPVIGGIAQSLAGK